MSKIKELEQLFTKGKISRRDFLARASALGLMVAVSPALFSTPVHAATPKKGGRLRLGVAGGSTTDSSWLKSTPMENLFLNWQKAGIPHPMQQNGLSSFAGALHFTTAKLWMPKMLFSPLIIIGEKTQNQPQRVLLIPSRRSRPTENIRWCLL
jgi:hypothetical protein